MAAALEIPDGIGSQAPEAVYQAFYPVCQDSAFDAAALLRRIADIYGGGDASLRSYCFLFFGAMVRNSGRCWTGWRIVWRNLRTKKAAAA